MNESERLSLLEQQMELIFNPEGGLADMLTDLSDNVANIGYQTVALKMGFLVLARILNDHDSTFSDILLANLSEFRDGDDSEDDSPELREAVGNLHDQLFTMLGRE